MEVTGKAAPQAVGFLVNRSHLSTRDRKEEPASSACVWRCLSQIQPGVQPFPLRPATLRKKLLWFLSVENTLALKPVAASLWPRVYTGMGSILMAAVKKLKLKNIRFSDQKLRHFSVRLVPWWQGRASASGLCTLVYICTTFWLFSLWSDGARVAFQLLDILLLKSSFDMHWELF